MKTKMINSVSFIPSSNGYGHLRRVSSIAEALKRISVVQTTLIWNNQRAFPQEICPADLFDKIVLTQAPYFFDGPPINMKFDSHSSIDDVEHLLADYDVVLSDTLTWPLLTREDAIFLGQFTWEFYHQRLGYQNRYTSNDALKLKWLDNPAFTMSDFAWDEMHLFRNLHRLPVFDYWDLRSRDLSDTEEILVSFSGTKSVREQSKNLNTLKFVPTIVRGLENYLQEKSQRPLGIICRPGLGIISECISARVLPIIIEEKDPEMIFNRKVLLEVLGIGVGYEQIENLSKSEVSEFLTNFSSTVIWPDVITSLEFAEKYMVTA